ncbi:unnamed protein product, partial [Prorocentrum cordatum]
GLFWLKPIAPCRVACCATGESEHAALVQVKRPEAGPERAAAAQTAAHAAPTSLLARREVCPGRGCAEECEEAPWDKRGRKAYIGRFRCMNNECQCLVDLWPCRPTFIPPPSECTCS